MTGSNLHILAHSNDMLIHRERIYVLLGQASRMLDSVREYDPSNTTATVTMHCNAAENALEAALDSVRRAKSEARLICYQREQRNPALYDRTILPPVRPAAALPAVGSFAAE